ncbi:MAG: serine--tRNA ligase, partial [Boseongicola sp.]|nr:serine--tRNA ligase [Boseongicola sp.]
MHDIRAIRENPAAFDAAMVKRGISGASSEILAIDAERRAKIAASEAAQAERNTASKEVGAAKAKGDEVEFERLRTLVAEKKDQIARLEAEAKAEDERLRDVLMGLPNLPYDDVPDGADEDDNVEIHRWGEPPAFDFKPKEHFEIDGVKPGMDFETAAKLSGSRFVLMSGAVARVHRALAQMMLDIHTTENGLTETITPVLVRDEAMYGTNQLPKFAEDSYQTREGMWLIPTSEVTLTNIVRETIIDADYLPRRYTAHTQCFRSEAGSAGKDTSGMLRQHQFEKVEMVTICHPDTSDDEQKRMLGCAEGILQRLGLAYRTIVLCTGDMG